MERMKRVNGTNGMRPTYVFLGEIAIAHENLCHKQYNEQKSIFKLMLASNRR